MTITTQVKHCDKAKLKGLIKANKWLLTQINKTRKQSLISCKELVTGTDGSQIFVDHNVLVPSLDNGTHDKVTIATAFDTVLNRLHVNVYHHEDFTPFECEYIPELRLRIIDAFIKAGILIS